MPPFGPRCVGAWDSRVKLIGSWAPEAVPEARPLSPPGPQPRTPRQPQASPQSLGMLGVLRRTASSPPSPWHIKHVLLAGLLQVGPSVLA